MTMGAAWYALYRGYDDETLAALANVGLLRRASKDVEAGRVAWRERGEARAVFDVDGQTVELDGRGPQHGRCDCPAPGLCKHILAGALYLRALSDTPVAGEGDSAADTALRSVLDLDPQAVFSAAGRAAVRRAAARYGQMPAPVLIKRGSALSIELPGEAPVRYIAGSGFDGMVSEAPPGERAALHVLALALVWREQGRTFSWPEWVEADGDAPSQGLSPAEAAFLEQVRQTLRELFEQGLSHVSEITAQRLRALNMSARGENLPRLAALLRNLAGIVDLLALRDHRAEEGQALAAMAQVHALCAALEGMDDTRALRLRGQIRRDFEHRADLSLLPLGANWWQTRGGARGLTLSFWHAESGRLLQAVLARPDGNDPGFDKGGAWSRQPLWQGAGTAQTICAAGGLELTNARLADDGRIALGGDTRARKTEPWRCDDDRLAALGFADWTRLKAWLQGNVGLLAERIDSVVLWPHLVHPPELDEVRQVLVWLLQDAGGTLLRLELPCETYNQASIDSLEQLTAGRSDIRGVLVQLEQGGKTLRLSPRAVLTAEGSSLRPISLEFAEAKPPGKGGLSSRIRDLLMKKRAAPVLQAATSSTSRLLDPVLAVLEYQAMVGHRRLDEHDALSLCQSGAALRAVGLDIVSDAIEALLAGGTVDEVLRLVYLCRTCMELDGLNHILSRAYRR